MSHMPLTKVTVGHFKRGSAIEIHDKIIFDFYMELSYFDTLLHSKYCTYEAYMSPTLNRSPAIQSFGCSNVTNIT